MKQTSSTIEYLFSLQKFGIKLGLENIKTLLDYLNNPHEHFKSIHVAGTNGKGSTSAMLASILQSAGYRVGLYTSPHLVEFYERIRVDGEEIPPFFVEGFIERVQPLAEDLHPTFFEVTTALAFEYFTAHHVDVAVIETGMGGRLDSTNILTPHLSIITNVAIDHAEYLGPTLEAIAVEKAGIIKPGIPVCIGRLPVSAEAVVRSRAKDLISRVHDLGGCSPSNVRLNDFADMKFTANIGDEVFQITLPFVGAHQIDNCLLALRAATVLQRGAFNELDREKIERGVLHSRTISGLRGRLERVSSEPEIIVDVAHNPDGWEKLLTAFISLRKAESTHIVFGLARSKDQDAIVHLITKHQWKSITVVAADSPESRDVESLSRAFGQQRVDVRRGESVVRGTQAACAEAVEGETVLLCGSHYVVGEWLEWTKHKTSA